DLGGLFDLRVDRPDLRYVKHVPTTAVQLLAPEPNDEPDIFSSIARRDILLHHPYESFATSVQAFLEGGRRPGRSRDQADPVPHLRRQ
ncbi:hypothetical protein QN393_25665, partial [Pseudomonas sp. AB12(2023)]